MTLPNGSNKPMTNSRPNTMLPDQPPVSGPGAHTDMPSGWQTAAPAGLSATPTLGALVLALKRRWLLATGASVGAATLAVAAIAIIFPPTYVVQARLELTPRSRSVMVDNQGEPEVDPTIYRLNQQAILKSPLVLSSALGSDKLKGLKIAGQSPEALETALKVDFKDGPEIMTIRLSGSDPENMADLLNAIIAAYMKEIETRDNQRKGRVIAQLENTLKENYNKLNDQRKNLHDQERAHDIPDSGTQQLKFNALSSVVAQTENALQTVRSTLSQRTMDLKLKEARLNTIDKQPISQLQVDKLLENSLHAQQLAFRLVELDDKIASWMVQKDGPNKDQQIAKLQADKTQLQESAKLEMNKLRPDFEKKVRSELEDKLRHDIQELEEYLSGLQNYERSLQEELARRQGDLKDLAASTRKGNLTVEQLREDIKQTEKTQSTLSDKVALLKAEPSAASKILILQAGETPTDKDYSRFGKLALGGGFGVFGLAILGVAFLEFRLRKVNGSDEVTQGLGLALVGTMPNLPAQARTPAQGNASPKDLRWQSILSESVDAIRTQLLHSARTDGTFVIMVTSAVSGEGKTSLASQLAASLARAWRKTLLVDADLRNPAAHKLFALPLEPGFCEVLRGEAKVADVVKPTLVSRLWLMPAGHWDAPAIQALAQDEVRSKFEQMKEQYDFIIVDSSPVLPVADSLLLGQHVDAVIFSVLREVTRLPSLYAAQHKLQNLGVRVLGAVVIGADNDAESAAYKYVAQTGSS